MAAHCLKYRALRGRPRGRQYLISFIDNKGRWSSRTRGRGFPLWRDINFRILSVQQSKAFASHWRACDTVHHGCLACFIGGYKPTAPNMANLPTAWSVITKTWGTHPAQLPRQLAMGDESTGRTQRNTDPYVHAIAGIYIHGYYILCVPALQNMLVCFWPI